MMTKYDVECLKRCGEPLFYLITTAEKFGRNVAGYVTCDDPAAPMLAYTHARWAAHYANKAREFAYKMGT
jgi:hypothetical protein